MMIYIKIFVIFLLCGCDVFAKVNFLQVTKTNKIANFIGELLNNHNNKEFSSIQDITIVKLSLECEQSDLFNEVLNTTIVNNPVLLTIYSFDFNVQRTRTPGFVFIFFNFEVRISILQLMKSMIYFTHNFFK